MPYFTSCTKAHLLDNEVTEAGFLSKVAKAQFLSNIRTQQKRKNLLKSKKNAIRKRSVERAANNVPDRGRNTTHWQKQISIIL